MKMYFVVSGYCGPNRFVKSGRGGPVLQVETFYSPAEVEKAYADFREEAYGADNCQQVFRVFYGEELKMEEVARVTEYKLQTHKG